jgi:2-keto-4-pentenoate hydratase/2-oxohepta-3-ene-1,7-dioic acid hydratase in catechol pathway
MRLVTYDSGDGPTAGVLLGEEIAPVGGSVRELLAADTPRPSDERVALDSVRLLPPVPDQQKIICMGLNYRDHAEEAGQKPPEHPLWFAKFANSFRRS